MTLENRVRGLLQALVRDYADKAVANPNASLNALSFVKGVTALPAVNAHAAIQWLAIDWDLLALKTLKRGRHQTMPLIAQLCLAFSDVTEAYAPHLARRLEPLRTWLLNEGYPVNAQEAMRDAPAAWAALGPSLCAQAARVWINNAALRKALLGTLHANMRLALAAPSTLDDFQTENKLLRGHKATLIHLVRFRNLKLGNGTGWTDMPSLTALVNSPIDCMISNAAEWDNLRNGWRNGVWSAPNYFVLDLQTMLLDQFALHERSFYNVLPYSQRFAELTPDQHYDPLISAANAAIPDARNAFLAVLHEVKQDTRAGVAKALFDEWSSLSPSDQLPPIPDDFNDIVFNPRRYIVVRRTDFVAIADSNAARQRPKIRDGARYRHSGTRETRILNLEGLSVIFRGGEPMVSAEGLPDVKETRLLEIPNAKVRRVGMAAYVNHAGLSGYGETMVNAQVTERAQLFRALITKHHLDNETDWQALYDKQRLIQRRAAGERVRSVIPFTLQDDQYLLDNWSHYIRKDQYEAMCKQLPQYTPRHIRLRGRFLHTAKQKGLSIADLRDKTKVEAAFGRSLHDHRHILACV